MSRQIKKITNTQSTALKNKNHPNKGTKKQIPASKKLTSQPIKTTTHHAMKILQNQHTQPLDL